MTPPSLTAEEEAEIAEEKAEEHRQDWLERRHAADREPDDEDEGSDDE